ncbi:hypothetical protein AHF37_02273 [Paragonimus kellicotti]|nr:hypothetical protein AHF37_02273 [Paragonimus kellicotti]
MSVREWDVDHRFICSSNVWKSLFTLFSFPIRPLTGCSILDIVGVLFILEWTGLIPISTCQEL